MPGCVMAMEACCGAHHLGRLLRDRRGGNEPAARGIDVAISGAVLLMGEEALKE
jgi:hypothetical protein